MIDVSLVDFGSKVEFGYVGAVVDLIDVYGFVGKDSGSGVEFYGLERHGDRLKRLT